LVVRRTLLKATLLTRLDSENCVSGEKREEEGRRGFQKRTLLLVYVPLVFKGAADAVCLSGRSVMVRVWVIVSKVFLPGVFTFFCSFVDFLGDKGQAQSSLCGGSKKMVDGEEGVLDSRHFY
jgi:hypothetical protein